MHVIIISMSVGDLLVSAVDHPFDLLKNRHIIPISLNACTCANFINWLGLAISALSLTLLNVDKLVYFRWPLKYLTFSVRRAAYLCLLIAGISLA
ncbi:Protein AEXR-1, partial [Aphelenchoides avenae]